MRFTSDAQRKAIMAAIMSGGRKGSFPVLKPSKKPVTLSSRIKTVEATKKAFANAKAKNVLHNLTRNAPTISRAETQAWRKRSLTSSSMALKSSPWKIRELYHSSLRAGLHGIDQRSLGRSLNDTAYRHARSKVKRFSTPRSHGWRTSKTL